MNVRTDTKAQPGKAHGCSFQLTCSSVQKAAYCDGLTSSCDYTKKYYDVTLVVWPYNDFHWYRMNQEGFWSHKPGRTPVKNTDDSGQIVVNPTTCDRGPYTDVCYYGGSIWDYLAPTDMTIE